MKYTREQLHEMSDFEVNQTLAILSCKELCCHAVGPLDDKGSLDATMLVDGEYIDRVINYCRNWNDVMPLAVEHRISLFPAEDRDDCEWYADKIFSCNLESCWSDVSPQRAIACCLILVLQEK